MIETIIISMVFVVLLWLAYVGVGRLITSALYPWRKK